ncbi:MAG: copper amine oxidase N-terminal domain-containing protein, partial [Eubacteriales bacterium]|nr:copper amine oxidase N-terminal domain-containing protein [Eubacteriales bacterium]
PIEEKFAPKLSAMDASVYNAFIDQLPSYLERVISKDFIKSVVSKNVADLQAKLPSLVESSRAIVDQEINDYIESMIEKETKIYIGQSYVKAPVAPRIVNNRLLVPFRAIATALGATVEWRYKERQVVMTKGDTNIVLTIDSNVVLVNGKETKIDAPAGIYESSTMVPVRFIAETFDMDVSWQPDWKMVSIEAAQ